MVERESRLVFEEPFLFFYIHNKTVVKLQDASGLDEEATRSLKVLLAWMETNFREDWDEADALFARGKVNSKHYSKLFRPSELAVSQNHNNQTDMFTAFKFGYSPIYTEMVPCTYEFDGTLTWLPRVIPSFNENCSRTGIVTEGIYGGRSSLESGGGLVNISDLDLYPIRFAEEELERKLIARGHKFWRLRKKCLVCHGEVDGGDRYQAERRYMIDYAMYKRLHRATEATKLRFYVSADEYDETSSAFFACLPPTILGFSFAKKSWEHLSVDRITDVTWNKTAFDQLVAPDETKELIQAMVTVHGDRSNAAQDIISGKGQGLLILLHGGPGTGKTLTAESIAEVQERPLYRVTCGDIGIEPKEVEQYLGDVLEIGKAWGCVVLLDEADVFLEERSFTDQKRNAVISSTPPHPNFDIQHTNPTVFLRVLEYYDGILILTTNRVGSFDEAFKSRIQLALAYPRLNEEDRLKIWQNFIQMLPRSGQRVDMEDLKMNLNKLALVEINGRQIRNAVTMARHLAKFRHEMLRYKHMQDALRSVQRFNKYLSDVKGLSDDEWAKADKLRLGD
ncbi:hypothetical protein AK830_g11549 [Neonectria ditissima]|uniref:AAA+ ATPase domain-containing protein n=1 Tax=Neonectria ditissima TaxID=78410 RepID=A0A0P7B133_9HYPO|nr:hypothetical protein AK830_g11549 [Neonectria ditissima]